MSVDGFFRRGRSGPRGTTGPSPSRARGGQAGRTAAPGRGPLVLAVVVLLLWGGWLLLPDGVRGAAPTATQERPSGGATATAPAADGPAVDGAAEASPPSATPEPSAAPEASATPTAGAQAPSSDDPAGSNGAAVPDVGDGSFVVAAGEGPRTGDGDLVRYSVEVEGGVPLDPAAVAAVVDRVLADPRSWTGDGRWALQRTGTDPDVRIRVASPGTTDALCAPLRTGGRLSCRNGDVVALNALRWTGGAEAWGEDLDGYREYLVNHEVGHYLGRGHEGCPGDGRPAPVMLQQTLGLQGCAANAWPHP